MIVKDKQTQKELRLKSYHYPAYYNIEHARNNSEEQIIESNDQV